MKLITMTVIKNRVGKMLEEWLEHTYSYSDKMVILDNDSTDGTLDVIKSFPDKENKIVLIPNVKLDFTINEAEIRAMLWESVKKKAEVDDWVMMVDSDEFMEKSFIEEKNKLLRYMAHNDYDLAYFKFCDMWSMDEYRVDGLWSPFFPRIFKFKNESWGTVSEGLHLSNIPKYALQSKNIYTSQYRVKHYSIHTPELRKEKYDYYIKKSTGVNLLHANTIMNKAQLKKLEEPIKYPKVMICSLIRNREWIIPSFLKGLENLDYPKEQTYYYFLVNNSTDKSLDLIVKWAEEKGLKEQTIVEILSFPNATQKKERDWNANIIRNMAEMRTRCLNKMLEFGMDYIFSVDSDLLLHPDVLKMTLLQDKEICSPVFWAHWNMESINQQQLLPQCWLNGGYHITPEWVQALRNNKMRVLCGGLGALTLIHKSVAEKGVTYFRVYTLPDAVYGEDRDFCTRAVCAGFDLWCHTFIESRHVDGPNDLKYHLEYIKQNRWWKDA